MGILEVAKEMFINQGIEKGKEIGKEMEAEKQKRLFVKNLLNTGKFSNEETASLAGVSPMFVQQVWTETNKK